MPVINSQKGGAALIRSTATETINLSDLAHAGETVNSATITNVMWSGTVTVTRNAVTILSLTGSGRFPLYDHNSSFTDNATFPIVITITGAGTLVLGLSKKSTFTSDYSGGQN